MPDQIIDKDQNMMEIDQISKSARTIDTIHAEVHEGELFTAAGSTATLADTDTATWLMIAPGSPIMTHTAFALTTSAGGKAELFENTNASANGTAITPFNNKRFSDNIAALSMFVGPTVGTGSDGTLIDIKQIGGGDKGKIGAEARSEGEWILGYGSVYMVRFTSQGGTNNVSLTSQWYEE